MSNPAITMLSTTSKNFNFYHNTVKQREVAYRIGISVSSDGLIPISEADYHAAGKERSKGNMVSFDTAGVMSIIDVVLAKKEIAWYQRVVIKNDAAVVEMQSFDELGSILSRQRDIRLYNHRVDLGNDKVFISDKSTVDALARYLVDGSNDQLKTIWYYPNRFDFEVTMSDMAAGYRAIIEHHARVRSEYAKMRIALDDGNVYDYVKWDAGKLVGKLNV